MKGDASPSGDCGNSWIRNDGLDVSSPVVGVQEIAYGR
jgi:hypothetical protein